MRSSRGQRGRGAPIERSTPLSRSGPIGRKRTPGQPPGEAVSLGDGPITTDEHGLPTVYCSACGTPLAPILASKRIDRLGGLHFQSEECPDHPDAHPSLTPKTAGN